MENENDILKADQDNGYIQYGEYTAMDIGQDKAGQNRIASGRLAGGGGRKNATTLWTSSAEAPRKPDDAAGNAVNFNVTQILHGT